MHLQGHIEVVCGSMFSGKTEELLRRLRRAQIARVRLQVFKPRIDDRYSDEHIQSHDEGKYPSTAVERAEDILDHIADATRVVGIDEAQFFDHAIVDVIQKLANRGIRVIVAGLDMDYRGLPFGPMPQLLSIAEDVTKLVAVCAICGGTATRMQRMATSKSKRNASQILVGAGDCYEARCRIHHEPKAVPSHERHYGLFTTEQKSEAGEQRDARS